MRKNVLISKLGIKTARYSDVVKYITNYRAFLLHLRTQNDNGKWPAGELERHRNGRIQLDGIAIFIGLTADEKKKLEREIEEADK